MFRLCIFLLLLVFKSATNVFSNEKQISSSSYKDRFLAKECKRAANIIKQLSAPDVVMYKEIFELPRAGFQKINKGEETPCNSVASIKITSTILANKVKVHQKKLARFAGKDILKQCNQTSTKSSSDYYKCIEKESRDLTKFKDTEGSKSIFFPKNFEDFKVLELTLNKLKDLEQIKNTLKTKCKISPLPNEKCVEHINFSKINPKLATTKFGTSKSKIKKQLMEDQAKQCQDKKNTTKNKCLFTSGKKNCFRILLNHFENEAYTNPLHDQFNSLRDSVRRCENLCRDELEDSMTKTSKTCKMIEDNVIFKSLSEMKLMPKHDQRLDIQVGKDDKCYRLLQGVAQFQGETLGNLACKDPLMLNTLGQGLEGTLEELRSAVDAEGELDEMENYQMQLERYGSYKKFVDQIYRGTAIKEVLENHCNFFGGPLDNSILHILTQKKPGCKKNGFEDLLATYMGNKCENKSSKFFSDENIKKHHEEFKKIVRAIRKLKKDKERLKELNKFRYVEAISKFSPVTGTVYEQQVVRHASPYSVGKDGKCVCDDHGANLCSDKDKICDRFLKLNFDIMIGNNLIKKTIKEKPYIIGQGNIDTLEFTILDKFAEDGALNDIGLFKKMVNANNTKILGSLEQNILGLCNKDTVSTTTLLMNPNLEKTVGKRFPKLKDSFRCYKQNRELEKDNSSLLMTAGCLGLALIPPPKGVILSAACAVGTIAKEGLNYHEKDKIYQYHRYCQNNSEVSCTWEAVKKAKQEADEAWDSIRSELIFLPLLKYDFGDAFTAIKRSYKGSKDLLNDSQELIELSNRYKEKPSSLSPKERQKLTELEHDFQNIKLFLEDLKVKNPNRYEKLLEQLEKGEVSYSDLLKKGSKQFANANTLKVKKLLEEFPGYTESEIIDLLRSFPCFGK